VEIRKPLKEIWLTANLPCSKRLKVMLPIWLSAHYLVESPAKGTFLSAIQADLSRTPLFHDAL